MTGFELIGLDHSPVDLAIYLVGWAIGWLLLARPRQLPVARADGHKRLSLGIVIPARNEAESIPRLLAPLVAQRRDTDRIIVVDDHSDDGTGPIALDHGVEVIVPPDLPDGWLGKPHACWHGASSLSIGNAGPWTLVFLDADVQPGPTLLDDLAAAVDADRRRLVSMQPWHQMETWTEQPSLLCNVTALMGCGAFTIAGPGRAANVAFGPVVAVDSETYFSAGGHANPAVRSMHTEDIGLARAIGRSDLFVGSPDSTTFRMYPSGVSELVSGWSRSIATGARFTPWWLALATLIWVASLAGGWIAAPIVYPFSAAQVWILGRRAGTVRPLAAVLFPLLVVVFVAVFVRSLAALVFRRDVTWKGRAVATRTD